MWLCYARLEFGMVWLDLSLARVGVAWLLEYDLAWFGGLVILGEGLA